jgi:hypothetical protein
MAQKPQTFELQSWDLQSWPLSVWPNDPKRAGWILRTYRPELLECGALTRIGKRIVVLGPGYRRFLNRHIGDVTEFQSNLPPRNVVSPAAAA